MKVAIKEPIINVERAKYGLEVSSYLPRMLYYKLRGNQKEPRTKSRTPRYIRLPSQQSLHALV